VLDAARAEAGLQAEAARAETEVQLRVLVPEVLVPVLCVEVLLLVLVLRSRAAPVDVRVRGHHADGVVRSWVLLEVVPLAPVDLLAACGLAEVEVEVLGRVGVRHRDVAEARLGGVLLLEVAALLGLEAVEVLPSESVVGKEDLEVLERKFALAGVVLRQAELEVRQAKLGQVLGLEVAALVVPRVLR